MNKKEMQIFPRTFTQDMHNIHLGFGFREYMWIISKYFPQKFILKAILTKLEKFKNLLLSSTESSHDVQEEKKIFC